MDRAKETNDSTLAATSGDRNDPPPFELDPRAALTRLGAVIYDWDIASDRLAWGANVGETLGEFSPAGLASGAAYAELISADSLSSRYQAIQELSPGDSADGAPYRARYRLALPDGGLRGVEDFGRCSFDARGRPIRAHGIVRLQAAEEASALFADGRQDRRAFNRAVEARLATARAGEDAFAVLIIGLENLAELNRRYGYEAADQAIEVVGRRLAANMRAIDAVAHCVGGRFAVLLSATGEEQLTIAARRLAQRASEEAAPTAAGAVRVVLRIGAAIAPRHGRNACRLLQRAEEAFDQAAGEPRRFAIYAPGQALSEARRRESAIADEIIAALNQRRILAAYQPVVGARDGRIAFYEALLRVRQEDGEIAGPEVLLPVAEKLGLIAQLDQRVFELALDRLAAEPELSVSVNVSVLTLRSPGWVERVAAALGARPGTASRLIVEIVETLALEPVDEVERLFQQLKALGVRIAMDDFGAGHTSFRNLRRLGIDIVKIDGAFVQNVANSLDDRVFVRSLADLARHLGLATVAEWVEDEEARRLLREWGVDLLQGRLLGRPELYEAPASAPARLALAAG